MNEPVAQLVDEFATPLFDELLHDHIACSTGAGTKPRTVGSQAGLEFCIALRTEWSRGLGASPANQCRVSLFELSVVRYS